MNINCILFGAVNLTQEEIRDKRILEVGSCDVNGSLRPFVESCKPREYIGVDVCAGKGVDTICDVGDLVQRFGEQSFDAVLSTELLEHVKDWRRAIHSIKTVCKNAGVILVTTRSRGFGYHGYPYDFWRYEEEDMQYIFGDCRIQKLERDPQKGVFLKAIKPQDFREQDLSGQALYSIVSNKRMIDFSEKDFHSWKFKGMILREKIKDRLFRMVSAL